MLGIIHAQRGNFAEAESLIAGAVRANGKNPAYLNSYGNVLDSLGRYDDAIRVLQKALKLQATYPEAYNNLGISLQHNGALDEAIAAFRQALRQKPHYREALYNIGNALKQQENYLAAIDAYQATLKIAPDYSKAINNLGIALLEIGRYEEASAQFDQCITMNQNSPELYLNRGIAWFRQKRYMEAVRDFEHVLRLEPNYANVHTHIAKTAYELGDDELAIQQYLAELERNPHHHEALFGLATICFTRGLYEDYWTLANAALAAPDLGELQRDEVFISQAIKAWLEQQPALSGQRLSQSDSIRTMVPSSLNNVRFLQAYHRYLEALTQYRQEHPSLYAEGNERTVFVIGDSHSLAAHGSRIEGRCRFEARLVVGAKVWHIANQQPNRFKTALKHAIASLPDGCDAAFAFGEIDCRPSEGIMPFLKKHPQDLHSYMRNLIAPYVARILEATQPRNIKVSFCGVPIPGYDLASQSPEDRNRLFEVIACFNQTLHSVTQDAGCRFVDLYADTRARQEANEASHLDGYHLQPLSFARLLSETVPL